MLTPKHEAFLAQCREKARQPVEPASTSASTSDATPGKHISAAARDAIGTERLRGQQREVLDIVVAAVRNGALDLTGKEIQARYRILNSGKDIDAGTVSARVNSLMTAKLLEPGPRRACTITGLNVRPVRPVAQQARLVR